MRMSSCLSYVVFAPVSHSFCCCPSCPALPAPSLSYPPHVLCQSLTKKYGEAPATVSLKEAREVRRSAQIGIGDAGDAAFAALVRSIGRLR